MINRVSILILTGILIFALTACQAAGDPTPLSNQKLLTAAEAEAIALTAANTDRHQASQIHTEPDTENGVKVYDVDFRIDDREYEYTVHAETGAILSHHTEYDPSVPASTTAIHPAPEKKITAKEAEAIALNHAGLTADAVRLDRTELDSDDGIPHYEVEFHSGGWEYNYDIHAGTGAILSHEKEPQD